MGPLKAKSISLLKTADEKTDFNTGFGKPSSHLEKEMKMLSLGQENEDEKQE